MLKTAEGLILLLNILCWIENNALLAFRFSDQSKINLIVIKNGIQHGYHATVYMLGCKPIHVLKLWFPLKLHDGGSGLRLNDGPDVKLKSDG